MGTSAAPSRRSYGSLPTPQSLASMAVGANGGFGARFPDPTEDRPPGHGVLLASPRRAATVAKPSCAALVDGMK